MNGQILWSEEFDRQFQKLARKRRRIFEDLDELLGKFDAGLLPGIQARGVGGLPVKVTRMRDRTSRRGQSGGYRVAYYYDDNQILLAYITSRDQLDRHATARILEVLRSAGLLAD